MAKMYYHEWTSTDDQILTQIMTAPDRKKVLERFKEAGERLQRTAKSCQNRWYEIRQDRTAV
ncbi:hypothetical protein B1748_23645 [Paenibacillus sp. MY03]|uniref:hypothetical protein n=1 Tax=Paenibacillus sp. MY03 TaxID=302980 RepID=UPI000B3C8412|nr:hypothetical protein [Paenibacillus sp. MY03]OUS73005.1 hypothetical protein B1748_23645 [Paenibacillus sp. MY03]